MLLYTLISYINCNSYLLISFIFLLCILKDNKNCPVMSAKQSLNFHQDLLLVELFYPLLELCLLSFSNQDCCKLELQLLRKQQKFYRIRTTFSISWLLRFDKIEWVKWKNLVSLSLKFQT